MTRLTRKPRVQVDLPVTVHCRRMSFSARLIDLSEGGARITGVYKATVGDKAEVEFRPGCRLSGKVVWAAGSHIGTSFDQALPGFLTQHLLPEDWSLRGARRPAAAPATNGSLLSRRQVQMPPPTKRR